MSWQPRAGEDLLRARAALLADIRRFFHDRDVLEVETPLLCAHGVTDPSIEAFRVAVPESDPRMRFLQTSPEYAMKRLLAAHRLPIYQITRAFRDGESGPRHNPEFTLLEWYRPGFDHHELMDEVSELVTICLGSRPVSRISYRELFQQHLAIDPLSVSEQELRRCAASHIDTGSIDGDRDVWLDLLLSHVIQPAMLGSGLVFVHAYPASQAALARVAIVDGLPVAQRFELFVDGVELANGYYELCDAAQQRQRFASDNERRSDLGLQRQPLDEYLLAALDSGLPQCSGVALGVDRLLALLAGQSDMRDVLAFDWDRA